MQLLDQPGVLKVNIVQESNIAMASFYEPCLSVATKTITCAITDFENNNIHLLDRQGQLLRYLIPDTGVSRPKAIAIDSGDSSRHLLKDIYHNMSRNIGLGAQAAMNTCADCSEPSVCTCSLCNTKICRHHLITHMDTVHFLADNDSDKTKCSVHSKYFLKTFCRTCRLPLCDVCVTDGGHVFHEKIDLDAILEFFNEVISDENQELISYIRPFYQKILDITNERKKGVPSNYKNVKHEIKQFAESLHKEIESVVQILYAEMDEKEKTETKQLQEQDDIYSLRISKVDETVLQNRQLMSSNNPIELTKFSSSLAYFHVNPSQVKEELPKFSPITNKEEIKEKLFGLFGEFCSM
ncbi:uncharacterized protein DDB_G0279899-like [Saccostrea cucullata]|uniref:uncharacterized protein DDB_G0279899-like n=1 Tax=Saccostrea cuccullata TaxID=36930 RepID=UPI002ED07F82